MPYANTTQLADYLGVAAGTLPTDAQRLLGRASELIQYATMDRVPEPVDPGAVPVDPAAITDVEAYQIACRKATSAQIEHWLGSGEEADIAGQPKRYTISKLSVDWGDDKPPELAPRARRYLFLAGLLYRGVGM